jgi:hypothetical protein
MPAPIPAVAGYNYSHQSSNTSGNLKASAGVLHNVTINTKGATSNTLTLYENTTASGTVIAVIDTTAQIQTLNFDVSFSTGLSFALAGGTAADVTIGWV